MKLNAKSPLTFGAVAEHWPEGFPLIALGGTGRHVIVPVAFSEVAWDDVKRKKLAARGGAVSDLPFRSGFLGLLGYDDCQRVFRVDRALVEDRVSREVHLTGSDAGSAAFEVPAAALDALLGGKSTPRAPSEPLNLEALAPESEYLRHVEGALAEIRAGRYYQINLLRYFKVLGDCSRGALASRLDRTGGPHAAAFDVPGLSLWSFSPERFVRIRPEGEDLVAETRPIKGTIARGGDDASDAHAAATLLASPKDRAELAMIVDLMRNDLARVSRRGSVEVQSPGHLLTVSSVHHLEATVASRLLPGLTLGELALATCPGGSVTGAPKIEVMRAIREREGRDRGWFMGNAFYLDDSGAFDSSILIRTLARRAGQKDYEFAAGSGIVVHSHPAAESREIDAKARVLT